MKLWHSPASPFVRKVLVAAHETGLARKLEIVEASTSAVNRNMKLVADNPSGKIPALVLKDGTLIADSSVICAYLDTLHRGRKLAPAKGVARFRVLTLESLGNAIMDAAVLARYERALRPEDKRWADWEKGQIAKVVSSLDAIEKRYARLLGGAVNIGAISVAAALGYLDFRFADLEWRKGRPGLAAWYEKFARRPSMIATAPKA